MDDIYSGMHFKVDNHTIKTRLHHTLKNLKYTSVDLICGVYFIKFKEIHVADILEDQLTLTPNTFLNNSRRVFKTYNLLLRKFVKGRYFIKFMNSKWVLCQEDENGD